MRCCMGSGGSSVEEEGEAAGCGLIEMTERAMEEIRKEKEQEEM